MDAASLPALPGVVNRFMRMERYIFWGSGEGDESA